MVILASWAEEYFFKRRFSTNVLSKISFIMLHHTIPSPSFYCQPLWPGDQTQSWIKTRQEWYTNSSSNVSDSNSSIVMSLLDYYNNLLTSLSASGIASGPFSSSHCCQNDIKNGHLPTCLLPTEESPAALAWPTGPYMIWLLPISPVSSLTTHLLCTSCSSLPHWITYIFCHIRCCSLDRIDLLKIFLQSNSYSV